MAVDEQELGTRTRLPEHGSSREELSRMLADLKAQDVPDFEARLFAGGSFPAGQDVLDVAKEAYTTFFSSNTLYNTTLFRSLGSMEREVIRMTGDLFHGPDATGSITSGGSESCLMGLKSARNRAREVHPEITQPEMVVPLSAHPIWWKGADYFGVKLVRAPLRDDLELDVDAYKDLINENTVLLVGTAPSMTLGMVDPIEELAPLAEERDINLHVDASLGGYFLPFAEILGRPIPTFDFRIPGVATISADLHKFGYTAKGASSIISRDADVFRHQVFEFGAPERPKDWYVTPSMTGTRPGGAIAAAWAVLNYLGKDGYQRLVGEALDYMDRFWAGIDAIDGLEVMGKPVMTLFGYCSTDPDLDIFAIAQGLEERGWLVSRDEWPAEAIRFMQSPGHAIYIDSYLDDLREIAALVRAGDIVRSDQRASYT